MILCEEETPTQVVYRSNITRYGDYSADQLVGYIEEWVQQEALLISGITVVTFDSNCTVRISGIDEPVCGPSSSTNSKTNVAVLISTALVLLIIASLMIALIIWHIFCTTDGKNM